MRRDQVAQLEFEYRGDEELWPEREPDDPEQRSWLQDHGLWLPLTD
jgi:hypothetical protein